MYCTVYRRGQNEEYWLSRNTYVCTKPGTVTPGLSDTGLSVNLIYPTLHCESPSLLCVQFTLSYPSPGLLWNL